MTDTPETPQLTDAAREEFRRSLLASAERILDHPRAADTLTRFLAGDVFLVLTKDQLYVRPVPPEQSQTETADTPRDDDGSATGVYL